MDLPVDMLAVIRDSCLRCYEESSVQIADDRIDPFLLSIDEQVWLKQSVSHGLTLPLVFETKTDELNVLSTLSLLNFLHAYRKPLKQRTGKGAYDFVLTLIIGAYLSDEPTFLDARSMVDVDLAKLASLGNLKTHVERQHESLPVTVGEKDEEVFEILGLVQEALRSTGRFLLDEKAISLGDWVERMLIRTNGDLNQSLRELARVPTFADYHEVQGRRVYLMKKACFLLHAVSHLVNTTGGQLPAFVDNVIPTMLHHHGLLIVPDSIHLPVMDRDQSTTVRAASLVACVRIVERARGLGSEKDIEWMRNMTEVQLDGYLWSTAKLGTTRDVERFVERGTIFY